MCILEHHLFERMCLDTELFEIACNIAKVYNHNYVEPVEGDGNKGVRLLLIRIPK